MKRNVLTSFIRYAYVWIFVVISLYPLLYMVILSLKSNDEFLSSPNGFLVKDLYLKNYLDAWNMGNFSVLGINTIYITAATIFLCIVFGATAGYAIEKLCGKDGMVYYNYFIIGIIIPIQVIMIPLFKVLKSMDMINNVIGIILLYTALNLSFSVFIFTGFFKAVPNQLIEAARIDGCSYFKSFWVIIFPLCKTITATIAIFVGMAVWKDFTVPLIYITNPSLKTLSIGLLSFKNQYMTNWPALSAAMIIQTLPITILFLAMQKYFIKGITAGAMKG